MQILRLKLSNLASLAGEQEIDFQQEPLNSAGIIAITGRTGSGKSTLLDAMCLALYDEIPRFRGSTHGTTADFKQASDSRQILTRGTGFGYAEIEFIGVDKKRYISRTEISRAYKRTNEKLKANSRSFICVDDGQRVLSTKTKECSALVIEKTGLNFEQFTRAILLAQSEVGAFLKAKDDERAQLLEHLTGSDIFKKIGYAAAEQYRQVKQEYDKTKQALGMVELLSVEELSEKQSEYQSLKNKIEQFNQQIEQAQQQKKLHEDYTQAQQDLTRYQQQLTELNQIDIHAQQQQLAEWEHYQQIAATWQQFQQLKLSQSDIEQKQQELQTQYELKSKSLMQAQQSFTLMQQQQQQTMPVLEQKLAIAPEVIEKYRQREHLIGQYRALLDKQKERKQSLEQAQQKLQNEQAVLQQYQQQVQDVEQQLQHWEYLPPQNMMVLLQEYQQNYQQTCELIQQHQGQSVSIVDWWQSYQQLQQKYQQFQQESGDIVQIQQQSTAIHQQIAQLEKQQSFYQNVYKSWQEIQQELADVIKNNTDLRTQYQQDDSVSQQLEQDYQTAEQYWLTSQTILEQQKLLHSDNVQFLRTQLQENQPCMVCGSHQHPYVSDVDSLQENLLALHQQQEQACREAKQQAYELWQNQCKKVQQVQYQLSNGEQQQFKIEQKYQQLQQDVKQYNGEIVSFDDLCQVIQENTAKMLALQEQAKVSQVMIEQDYDYQQALGEHVEIVKLYQIVQHHESKIGEQLTPTLLLQWQADALMCAQNWSHDLQIVQKLQQQMADLMEQQQRVNHQMGLLQQSIDYEQQQVNVIVNEMNVLIEQGKKVKNQLDIFFVQYHLTEEEQKNPQAWQQHLLKQKEDLLYKVQQANEQQQQLQYDVSHCQQQFEWSQQQLAQNMTQMEQAQELIQQWQQQYQRDNSYLEQMSVNDDIVQRIQQLREDIQHYQQQSTELKTKLNMVQQSIAQMNIQTVLTDVLYHLEQLTQQKSESMQLFESLGAELKLQESQQAKYQHYQAELEQAEKLFMRWDRIYSLIGKKDGVEFQRIAQQHYLDILLEYANYQLAQLTQRYELRRIAETLSLSIIDHDMNDEERGVLSLSGGESFLVSLSLALGIAHMASNHIQLETLFIDEGFGTLDHESLHMVMDTLDRLQNQGRKVILISHIAEVHERIPVKIRVQRIGAGESRIQIE